MYMLNLALFWTSFLFSRTHCQQDYSVTPITTSSGLYYEKVGEILLSNSNWQFVTSVDYRGYLLFYEYLLQQANEISTFCQTLNSTVCNQRYNETRNNLNRIEDNHEALTNFLGIEENKRRRVKRFWQGFVLAAAPYILEPLGNALVGKIFGDMDQDQLKVYDQQITDLYKKQRDLEYIQSMQMTAFTIDSERKSFQINWLARSQNQLENNIKLLQHTVTLDAKEKQKQIDNLTAMLKETKKQLKMQKEAQDKLVNDVNDIKIQLKTVNDDIKYIRKEIDTNKMDIDALKIETKLHLISTNFNLLLSRFETEQKTLFDVIKNANRGDLDPYIITPLNLIQMLEKAHPMLPEGTKFPFYPNFENAQKLYKLIKPTVYLFNNKIMFILDIPVVNVKTFNLHKITSLPISMGDNSFAFILPEEPYLMVDMQDQEYGMLSWGEFREYCKDVNTGLYLCDQIGQTSSSLLNPDCEMQIFLNCKSIPDTCNKRVMRLEKPVFLQLQSPMSWIYAVPDSETLLINSGHHRIDVHLSGSGILRMNSSCSARTSNYKLVTVKTFTSKKIFSSFSPRLNISDSIDLSYIDMHKKTSQKEIVLSPFDFKQLEAMSVDARVVVASGISVVYIAVLVTLGVVLLVTGVLFWRRIYRGIFK